ncbi:hypothetical protein H0H87_010532 [Tephrocybe sp. NHM501043]|nr:hypothetical protein H0H87_010532 [Tephrocybe sp. NHM501043]
MLLNVVPPVNSAQLCAVVFSVVFENLDPLPNPSTWTSQLHNLRLDELEVPVSVHALDKSVGIISLLEEVTFDLSTNIISCHFVDGSMERWPLEGAQCIKVLESVVRDVNESLAIEREMEEEKNRGREYERRAHEAPLPPIVKPTRHKKQRSLLMTLVASIIPLYTPSSNSRLPSPPPTPINERVPSETISPRDCRRRARSDLVDAFRRYALTKLSQHVPRGGYTSWIIHSMLRRITETMGRLIREAGGSTETDPLFLHHPHEAEFFSITAESLPSTPSVSDDEGDNFTTDTEESSLHTPTSPITPAYPVKRHSHVSRSPRRLLSESNYTVYAHHATLANRLRRLVAIDVARQEQDEEDLKHHHNVLEIRSRRRAWLNKALHGGVRSQDVDLSMSTVYKTSPLTQEVWSCDEYEYDPEDLQQPIQRRMEYEEYDRMELRVKREPRCRMTSRLFPVSEEEDGEVIDNATILDTQELELELGDAFEIDLEGGVRCNDYDDGGGGGGMQISLEVERPQLRPRVRTSSMYKHRLRVPPPAQLSPDRPQSPQFESTSLFCQPLPGGPSQDDDFSQPPEYTEVDVNLNVSQVDISGYGGFDKFTEDEFTLAMDLPVSVRVQDRGVLADKRRLSFKSAQELKTLTTNVPSVFDERPIDGTGTHSPSASQPLSSLATTRATTPFIPEAARFPPSPYSGPRSRHASPYRGNVSLPPDDGPERYAFPRTGSAYDAGYESSPWDYVRDRRPSWHGDNQSPWPGVAPPQSAPAYGYGAGGGYTRERRHSFNAAGYPQYPQLQLNPLLNAEVPNLNFFMDLSAPTFEPLMTYGRGETIPLPAEELAQPATFPIVTRMRVICELLPKEWRLNIELPHEQIEYYVKAGYDPPPITLSDVLTSLHRHLHKPVSHSEWGHLPEAATREVSRAFAQRCWAASGGVEDRYQQEVSRGLRRVDYLKGKTRILGLLRAGTEEGMELMKLVTDSPRV